MNTAVIRAQLHKYIEGADDQQLQAIFTLIASDMNNTNQVYSKEMIDLLLKRRQNHLDGNSITYSAEVSMQMIRAYKK